MCVTFVIDCRLVLVVPSLAYRVPWTHLPSEFGIAFGVTGLLSLSVVFWVAKELNQLMTDRPAEDDAVRPRAVGSNREVDASRSLGCGRPGLGRVGRCA